MTTNHSRLYLLSAAVALLSAACSSSSGSGSSSNGGAGGNASSGGSTGNDTTSSSSSSGSGGAACQPARLVGASYAAGAWRMAALDPATGTITALGPLVSATSFAQSGSAYDPATKHIYLLGDDVANHPTVLTIDGLTGATLAAVGLPDFSATNPEVVGGGVIVVLHKSGGSWETATLDAATGTVTSLSPLPDNGFSMSRGFDPSTNHLFEIGNHNGAGNVLTIDVTTGALLHEAPTADIHLDSAVLNGAGEILGMHEIGSDWHVARLDPGTGAITDLAPVTLTGVYSGMGAFDPCTNRLYELTPDGVLTADGTSGAVISLVPLLGEQGNLATIDAVW
jgi:hypothetical protein